MLWVRVEWKEGEVLTGLDPGIQKFQQSFWLAHLKKGFFGLRSRISNLSLAGKGGRTRLSDFLSNEFKVLARGGMPTRPRPRDTVICKIFSRGALYHKGLVWFS